MKRADAKAIADKHHGLAASIISSLTRDPKMKIIDVIDCLAILCDVREERIAQLEKEVLK